jgi:hypothetical protein
MKVVFQVARFVDEGHDTLGQVKSKLEPAPEKAGKTVPARSQPHRRPRKGSP